MARVVFSRHIGETVETTIPFSILQFPKHTTIHLKIGDQEIRLRRTDGARVRVIADSARAVAESKSRLTPA